MLSKLSGLFSKDKVPPPDSQNTQPIPTEAPATETPASIETPQVEPVATEPQTHTPPPMLVPPPRVSSMGSSIPTLGRKRITQRINTRSLEQNPSGFSTETAQKQVDLPLQLVLKHLPREVLNDDAKMILEDPQSAGIVHISAEQLLSMLPSGKLEFTLKEVVGFVPPSFFLGPEQIAPYYSKIIEIPIHEVVDILPPELLSKRPDQQPLAPDIHAITNPFSSAPSEPLSHPQEQAHTIKVRTGAMNTSNLQQANPSEESDEHGIMPSFNIPFRSSNVAVEESVPSTEEATTPFQDTAAPFEESIPTEENNPLAPNLTALPTWQTEATPAEETPSEVVSAFSYPSTLPTEEGFVTPEPSPWEPANLSSPQVETSFNPLMQFAPPVSQEPQPEPSVPEPDFSFAKNPAYQQLIEEQKEVEATPTPDLAPEPAETPWSFTPTTQPTIVEEAPVFTSFAQPVAPTAPAFEVPIAQTPALQNPTPPTSKSSAYSINHASFEELSQIAPQVLAKKIVAWRDLYGHFSSIADLAKIPEMDIQWLIKARGGNGQWLFGAELNLPEGTALSLSELAQHLVAWPYVSGASIINSDGISMASAGSFDASWNGLTAHMFQQISTLTQHNSTSPNEFHINFTEFMLSSFQRGTLMLTVVRPHAHLEDTTALRVIADRLATSQTTQPLIYV